MRNLGLKEKNRTIDDIAILSPTLQNNLNALSNNGWKVEYGEAGKGSYANNAQKGIVLDSQYSNSSEYLTGVLVHEAGHALYDPGYIPPTGIAKEQYLEYNVTAALKDEREATISNVAIRQEILNNGGPDIGAVRTQPVKYVEIYNDVYVKEGNRDKVRHEIGKIFPEIERPCTASDKTYEEYYKEAYSEIYGKFNIKPEKS